MDVRVKLANLRIRFAQNLFNAHATEEGKVPKFSCSLIVPKTDAVSVERIEAAALASAKDLWKGRAEGILESLKGSSFYPLRDGDAPGVNLEKYPELEGVYYVNPTNRQRPNVFGPNKEAVVESDGVVYSGCYVHAAIDIFAYDVPMGKNAKSTKPGIFAKLIAVKFCKEGDAFTARSGVSEDEFDEFDDLADTGDEDLV